MDDRRRRQNQYYAEILKIFRGSYNFGGGCFDATVRISNSIRRREGIENMRDEPERRDVSDSFQGLLLRGVEIAIKW